MPLFEFSCLSCGNQEELLILGKELPRCSQCGSADLKKLVSRFNRRGKSDASSADLTPIEQAVGSGHECTSSCNHGPAPSCSEGYISDLVKRHDKGA